MIGGLREPGGEVANPGGQLRSGAIGQIRELASRPSDLIKSPITRRDRVNTVCIFILRENEAMEGNRDIDSPVGEGGVRELDGVEALIYRHPKEAEGIPCAGGKNVAHMSAQDPNGVGGTNGCSLGLRTPTAPAASKAGAGAPLQISSGARYRIPPIP